MAKIKTIYACQKCGAQQPRWLGRCPECGEWNSLAEERLSSEAKAIPQAHGAAAPIKLSEITGQQGGHIPTGIAELDRTLGSGYIPGSAVLIGGDPGIGKSTIIMQALSRLAGSGRSVLYVSGEESAAQIKLRADRMSIAGDSFAVLTETSVEDIIRCADEMRPDAIAIDSIQTMATSDLESPAGTIGQVRESAGKLIAHAKASGVATFIVGHVTKDGAIAGPKVMEHMVDTVLYFEGERGHPFRILRTMKNRFGSTNEIGVFEMTGKGLMEVPNPSGMFLAERPKAAAGSAVVASLEGSRPVLLEVQALVTPSGFATSRRTAIGVDTNRVALLVAVLEKTMGLDFKGYDVFVNVAGGMRITEPAADAGIISAINSSLKNAPIDHETVIMGEVGLTGEIRAIMGLEMRLKEAKKMGFRRAMVPKSSLKTGLTPGLEVYGVSNSEELLKML
jgi:DNA repair protein RadA/Sms